ncbi:MAG: hypothetical protein WCW02_01520 [Candidatus Buchananbacteria bacterium]
MSEKRELQIKIATQVIPEDVSDRTLFALFDFLLTDKTQQGKDEKVEPILATTTDYENKI